MAKKLIMSLTVVVMAIMLFYGSAFCGGGREDPGCEVLPAPDAGKFLRGEFTVALDPVTAGSPGFEHYNFHATIKREKQTHLFSDYTIPGNMNLCDFTASDLKELYAITPCTLKVGAAFGLSGIPVITDLEIKHKDFCSGDPLELKSMISGEIVIRVVP